uniref:Barrier-to-autointegration factor n=1 Tax=Buteo japonicus TaxID=224669 RepID=A0A8C0BDG8_9AVES
MQRWQRAIPRDTGGTHRGGVTPPPSPGVRGAGAVPGNVRRQCQAYVVLGQFLVLRKDEELFREWLKETCGANAKQSRDCSGCLREWCDAFL